MCRSLAASPLTIGTQRPGAPVYCVSLQTEVDAESVLEMSDLGDGQRADGEDQKVPERAGTFLAQGKAAERTQPVPGCRSILAGGTLGPSRARIPQAAPRWSRSLPAAVPGSLRGCPRAFPRPCRALCSVVPGPSPVDPLDVPHRGIFSGPTGQTTDGRGASEGRAGASERRTRSVRAGWPPGSSRSPRADAPSLCARRSRCSSRRSRCARRCSGW